MNKVVIGLIGIAVVAVIIGGSFISGLIGINNQCAAWEKSITAQYSQNKNNYDNFYKKVKEVAQVPDMYASKFKEVYDGMMKGRYGQEGSKAVFQWIQENNPQFNSSMYEKIQVVIEAGRNSFEANQKSLLDKKRVYETMLNTFPDGWFAKFTGWPKIDLKEYDIVTSDITEETFSKKKATYIQIQ